MSTQRLAKVTNAEGFVRDMSTGAILNLNTEEINRNRLIRERERAKRQEIERHQEEINCIKGELCEIKQMLMQLISSKS